MPVKTIERATIRIADGDEAVKNNAMLEAENARLKRDILRKDSLIDGYKYKNALQRSYIDSSDKQNASKDKQIASLEKVNKKLGTWKKPFSLAGFVGYGFTATQRTPFVGAGIAFDLWSFSLGNKRRKMEKYLARQ